MRLVVATKNTHKTMEIKAMLAGLSIDVVDLNDLDVDGDIEETGSTFQENACIKAREISLRMNDIVMADDSGIEIDAFDQQPGIYSARFLGHETSYDVKNRTILERMKDKSNRDARFVCAIALFQNGKQLFLVEETFEGEVAHAIAGTQGFGYDPIFYYPPLHITAAEMTDAQKNEVSHRGKAMKQVIAYLQEIML